MKRRIRRIYLRTLRLLIGTQRRQYATLAVAVVLAFMGVWLWHKHSAPPSSTQLLSELSTVMIIPKEQPQIATVTDAASLKAQQPFYVDVANGDVLFLFPQTGKAVLFRPSTHQIVNAGPVNMQSPSTPQ
jgi:hypothetical protein